ncbi:MAG: sulfate ABC transporter substrate-binding protein [Synechococcales bacterium]|nr:sulfate ABC transporter substrate-binding protein [Synechococcales bacterium]
MGTWVPGGRFVWRRLVACFLIGWLLVSAIACGRTPMARSGSFHEVALTLVTFSVTKAAYAEILPKFAAKWKQETGQTVIFRQSYGASGVQARSVIEGLEADIVHLALSLDTEKISSAGLIQPGWESEAPYGGIVSKSVAALVTREDNPKGIKDWTDLGRDGITWVTADPKTSGGARWNFMALWNAALQPDRMGQQQIKPVEDGIAQKMVAQAIQNVPVLARDAREASDVFIKQGKGDAMINYENEVILAIKKGMAMSYTIPPINLSIDNPIAIVDENVDKHGTRKVTEAFLQYLYQPEAQIEFAKAGFRPVNPTVANLPEFVRQFPPVRNLAKIQDYGGWAAAQRKFFDDGAIFDQLRN